MTRQITFYILLFNIIKLFSTEYYVDTINGSDGNNGLSSTSAFRSLGRVESINFQPGDIVYFMEGTYTRPGQTLLTLNESGTADNWITFKNYPNHKPIFEFDGWTGIEIINGGSYIKFEGLTIKGAREKVNLEDAINQPAGCAVNFEGNAVGLYNGTGILVVGPNLTWSNYATTTVPHHITIDNCEIFDCTSSGVAFQQADYITITNNKIYNNCWYTTYGTSGINFYQFVNTDGTTDFHNIVTNNLMYGNQLLVPQIAGGCKFHDGNGFIVDDFKHVQVGNYKDPDAPFESYTAKTLVANNVSVENGGSGLHFFLSNNCYVYNNTVVNNAFQNGGVNSNGELRIGRCDNFVIKNNIFKGEFNLHSISGNTNIEYTHNYQFGPGIQGGLVDCEDCIEDIDIEFLNTDVDSFAPYITDFSVALNDAGTVIAEINGDYLYQSRPYGTAFDIGAYELREEDPCELFTWYADFDEDGLGDENDTILACEQPEGYVAESGDLCPTDNLKTDPGNCGCGEAEDSCTEPEPEICDAPEFEATAVYDTPGTVVIYEGIAYSNLWYASGILPTSGGPWELVGFCDVDPSDCSFILNWSSTTTYANPGTQVVFEGEIFENKWYVAGSSPAESNAWQLIGFCGIEQPQQTATLSTSNYTVLSNIKNNSYQISIYNLGGQLLAHENIVSADLNSFVSNIKLPSGMYILNVFGNDNGTTEIRKIIK